MTNFNMIEEAIKEKYNEKVCSDLIDELNGLYERDRFLCALEAAGVDNWSDYGYAYEILEEWDDEDKYE